MMQNIRILMSPRSPSGFTDIKKPIALHHPMQAKNLHFNPKQTSPSPFFDDNFMTNVPSLMAVLGKVHEHAALIWLNRAEINVKH